MITRSLKLNEAHADEKIDLRIIGVPRSGTNFIKFLLETGAGLRCSFNVNWWKHAVIPPLMNGSHAQIETIPTIILHREPVKQMVSFYRFSCKGRTAITGNHTNFSLFLRSPIIMKPNSQLELWFPSPVAYWIQFYAAALSWSASRIFVDSDAAQSSTAIIEQNICRLIERKITINADNPNLCRYMGRNPDVPVGPDWSFEDNTTLENEDHATAMALGAITDNDRRFILNAEVQALRAKLLSPS